MSCTSITLKGIGLGCKDNTGGIKEVYLIKNDDVKSVTLSPGKDAITAIELGEAAKFKTYKFRKGTSSMSSTATTDDASGNFSVQTDLSLQFSKMDEAKRLEIMGMCLEELKGIVLDWNGRYWLLGLDFPISASAATGNTGTNLTDFAGYNVTLTDFSREFPYEIPEDVISTVKPNIDPAPVA